MELGNLTHHALFHSHLHQVIEVCEFVSLVDFVETIKGVPKWSLLGCNVKSDKPPKKRITKLFHLNCSGHFSKGKTYPSSSKVYVGRD